MNTYRNLFLKHAALNGHVSGLLKDIETIEKQSEILGKAGEPAGKIRDFRENALYEASRKYQAANREKRATLEKKMEAVRARYQRGKSAESELLNLHRLELRFKAMSAEELKAAAREYLAGSLLDRTPDEVDVLVFELSNRGEKGHSETLRKAAVAKGYTEPWCNTEEGKAVSAEMADYPDEFGVTVLKTESGRVDGLEIKKLFD